jgi:hypothetical protein
MIVAKQPVEMDNKTLFISSMPFGLSPEKQASTNTRVDLASIFVRLSNITSMG